MKTMGVTGYPASTNAVSFQLKPKAGRLSPYCDQLPDFWMGDLRTYVPIKATKLAKNNPSMINKRARLTDVLKGFRNKGDI